MKEIAFGVLGGLALFIYGMNLMSDGLKKAAGERLRKILEKLTSNPIMGVLVGLFVTAVIQSSSATTVMVVGFVTAGLMTLTQAIGVIMGANIGTTITAQLIAFNIGAYAYLIAAIGFVLFFFVKKRNLKHIGQVIFGFGVLFIGLEIMSSVLKPLAENPVFRGWIVDLGKNPIVGVLVGTVMTFVIQSSSATIGVLQRIAEQPIVVDGVIKPLIPLTSAIPILFGDNIGTTITAWLATIGSTNRNAKRTALVHTLFNVFGTIIGFVLFQYFIQFVLMISPKVTASLTEASIIKRQIANAHTSFNLLNTLIWLPFTGFLAFLVKKIIPGEDTSIERGTKYLDYHVLDNPAVALDLTTKELTSMAVVARDMLAQVRNNFISGNTTNSTLVSETEENLDEIQQEVVHYLSTLVSQVSLTEEDSRRLADLMHVAGDIERIGDHCVNIIELIDYNNDEKIRFSENAYEEIREVFNLALEMLNDCISALPQDGFADAHKVLELEQRMDILEKQLRTNHIERLNQGLCSPKSAVSFAELMKNLERIADHCNNIAEAVLDRE